MSTVVTTVLLQWNAQLQNLQTLMLSLLLLLQKKVYMYART